MNFILRAVFILLVFAFVVYVLKAIARLGHNMRAAIKDLRTLREQTRGGPAASAEMMRCVTCGAYVASRDAVVMSSRGRTQVFCSQACVRVRVAS